MNKKKLALTSKRLLHNERIQTRLIRVFVFSVLLVGMVITVAPFFWMILSSMKHSAEIIRTPPTIFPEDPTLVNFRLVLEKVQFVRYYLNSLLVACTVTAGVLFVSSICGYIFGKFTFFGKNTLFLILLGTMMIPFQLSMIPLYLISFKIGLIDTYGVLILPWIVSAFGIFLVKQFAEGIPSALIDAARVDGCSEYGIFARVVIPELKPVLAALGIFTFLWSWNDYLWPLVAINSMSMRTIPVGLGMLGHQHATRYDLTMAGATMAVVPVIIALILFQKYIIKGISLTGMK